jgi:hypothetical protein
VSGSLLISSGFRSPSQLAGVLLPGPRTELLVPIPSSCGWGSGTVLVSFLSLWKIPEIINFKKGKVYFGSQFQRSQSVVSWPQCLWAYGEEAHHGGEHMVQQNVYLLVARRQKGRCLGYRGSSRPIGLHSKTISQKTTTTKGGGKNSPFKVMPAAAYLPSSKSHLLIPTTFPYHPQAGHQALNTWAFAGLSRCKL